MKNSPLIVQSRQPGEVMVFEDYGVVSYPNRSGTDYAHFTISANLPLKIVKGERLSESVMSIIEGSFSELGRNISFLVAKSVKLGSVNKTYPNSCEITFCCTPIRTFPSYQEACAFIVEQEIKR